MIFTIVDSDSGDLLGAIELPDDASDEGILEALAEAGYIQPPADCYEITDGDFLNDDGDKTVRDEFGDPVLCLMPDTPDDEDETDDETDTEETDHAE